MDVCIYPWISTAASNTSNARGDGATYTAPGPEPEGKAVVVVGRTWCRRRRRAEERRIDGRRLLLYIVHLAIHRPMDQCVQRCKRVNSVDLTATGGRDGLDWVMPSSSSPSSQQALLSYTQLSCWRRPHRLHPVHSGFVFESITRADDVDRCSSSSSSSLSARQACPDVAQHAPTNLTAIAQASSRATRTRASRPEPIPSFVPSVANDRRGCRVVTPGRGPGSRLSTAPARRRPKQQLNLPHAGSRRQPSDDCSSAQKPAGVGGRSDRREREHGTD